MTATAEPAAAGAASAPANPCATCGACCTSYMVPVFGRDVWLISARQRLGAEQFVVIYPEKPFRSEAFQLAADGPSYGLALDKRGPFRPKSPCVFLIQLPGQNARCGVYEHRPVVCRTYPMSLWSGVVAQRPQTLCPPGSWPLPAVHRPAWRAALHQLCMQLDIYGEVVARWNARVQSDPHSSFPLPEFLSYVLNVYDRLASLDGSIGAEALAAVEAAWPTFPRPAFETPETTWQAFEADRGAVWLRHFFQARQIIDSFYPSIAPQPPALRAGQDAAVQTIPSDAPPLSASKVQP